MAVIGLVPERPPDGLQQARRQDLLGIDRHCAGFDLRQVENVADQVEQVGAGAVDGAGEFDLLGGKIAVRIFGELLAENQDAVERRAQLMRHVGEEFGLVLRGQRKLGRLFLERAPRLFDFLVLSFHLDVALGELLGLLLELVVGLLQFLLLRLQFAGELLGLLQQSLGLHRGLDGIEHDADAVGQLFEEGHLRGGERADRGELDHGLDLVLEQHRKHDDILRDHTQQSRIDRRRIAGDVRHQPLPLVHGALADQSFTELHDLRVRTAAIAGIGGEQAQLRVLGVLHLIDHAHMRVDQRRQFGQQQPADGREVALALQHVGEPCKVGLEPVLLGVHLGGEAEIADHRVDVVFEFGDFAAGVDLDRARQVALGHGGRDLGDRTHL